MTSLPSSPFVVRGDRLRAGLEARDVLAKAEADAAQVRSKIAAERHAALEDGRVEGLRQGLAEAAALAAEAARAVDLFWREHEAELGEVALAVAHRVLSSLPRDETVTRLALEAVAEHGRCAILTLRVGPDAAAPLRAALAERGADDRVSVIADPIAPPGACTLVHARGRTEVGLLAQFRALLDALPGSAAPSSGAGQ